MIEEISPLHNTLPYWAMLGTLYTYAIVAGALLNAFRFTDGRHLEHLGSIFGSFMVKMYN